MRILLRSATTICFVLPFFGAFVQPSRSFSLWGFTLREPIDPSAGPYQCFTGRAFASDGGYRITADDVLFAVPHEHRDSAAVLAALDSVRVCLTRSEEHRFLALLTLRHDVVMGAKFSWVGEDGAGMKDKAIGTIARLYGPGRVNEHGVRKWEQDSATIWLNTRGWLGPGTYVTMSDRAACEWFEDLVHQKAPRPIHTNPDASDCWVPHGLGLN